MFQLLSDHLRELLQISKCDISNKKNCGISIYLLILLKCYKNATRQLKDDKKFNKSKTLRLFIKNLKMFFFEIGKIRFFMDMITYLKVVLNFEYLCVISVVVSDINTLFLKLKLKKGFRSRQLR